MIVHHHALATASFFRRRFTIAFALALLMFSVQAFAAASSIRLPGGGRGVVSARQLDRDFTKGTLEVKGDVRLVYNGQSITADSAVVNERDQTITLKGNVVIASPQAYIEGSEAVLNYGTNTGVFKDAYLKSGQVVFEGSMIEKKGDKQYEATNAFFTACDTCPPAWSFSGKKIDAELGGYAAITKPLFRVGNVPVFWFPYLVVPLKSERQTGFLVPKLEYIANNAGFGIPFFWAISPSQDATVTLKTYTRRGFKGHVNYRYMLDPNSEGEMNAAIIRDKTFADEQSISNSDVGLKKNRWFLTYAHRYELPYDFSQKTKLNIASDLQYLRDFPYDMDGQGDPALENRMSLTRNTELTHSSFEIDYYINELKRNALSSNRDAVHRWPEIRYSIRHTPVMGSDLLFRFNANYVNFAREDYAFDDVTVEDGSHGGTIGSKIIDQTRSIPQSASSPGTPGVFDPNLDLIRAGQRLDLQPEFSYPFRLGPYLDILPSLQLRHTQYSFNLTPPMVDGSSTFDPTPYRQYVRGEISARTRFFRVYGDEGPTIETPAPTEIPANTNSGTTAPAFAIGKAAPSPPPTPSRPDRYRHEIMPEVIFASVPYLQETSSKFFGEASKTPVFQSTAPIDDTDFQSNRGVQFDYNDRVLNRNTISFVINNRLVRKRTIAGSPKYSQLINWRFGQTYDLDESKKINESSYPWSSLYSLLDVRHENFLTNTEVRYFPYHRVANTAARLRFINGQNYIGANFIQTFRINPDLDDTPNTREIGLELGLNSRYFRLAGIIAFTPQGFSTPLVKSYGTELLIKPPGNCWGIGFTVKQLAGDAIAYDLSFDYNFGGASPNGNNPS